MKSLFLRLLLFVLFFFELYRKFSKISNIRVDYLASQIVVVIFLLMIPILEYMNIIPENEAMFFLSIIFPILAILWLIRTYRKYMKKEKQYIYKHIEN